MFDDDDNDYLDGLSDGFLFFGSSSWGAIFAFLIVFIIIALILYNT